MKYCKKCGMLLEDNMERCIGCGTDVTDKKSYSRFPEPVQQQLEIEKKERGKKALALVAITLVFIAILLMVGIYLSQTYMLMGDEDGEGPGTGMFTQMLMNSKKNDKQDAGADSEKKNRQVKDENGSYYKYTTLKDEDGNELFTAVYPEDLTNVEVSVDCSRNSQKFPAVFSFVATNDDNTTQLTFTSPQHYQYIEGIGFEPSEIQENVGGCISFYEFTDVESYLKEIIKQAYPTAKKIEALDEASEEVSSEKLDKLVEEYDVEKTDNLADLFGLPEGTSFKHTDTYKSDKVLGYRILTKEDHAVTCRFYVPVFCVNYEFDNPELEMNGRVSDCYILTVSSFEAGSDELYDSYENAFSLFINNYRLSDAFLGGVDKYVSNINESLKKLEAPKILSEKEFGALLKDSPKAGKFTQAVGDFLSAGKDAAKTFKADKYTVNTGDSVVLVYYNPEKELLFTSGDDSEYPGDDYIELK